jgi:epoxyqueuosine reductase
METLTSNAIKAIAEKFGADLCGIASVDAFTDCPTGFHPTDVFKDAKSVISIACKVPEGSLLINTPVTYTAVEDLALARVSQIALSLCVEIEKHNGKGVLVPSVPYDYWDEEQLEGKGILSLKHIGHHAGLGYIGHNSLLCNPYYGNLIKLGALLTDIELEADKILEGDMDCENCNLCVESCPVSAIEDGHVSQKKCRPYSETNNKRGVEIYSCHTCRQICPNRNKIITL